jgi:predicted MFS family arabinose efflux permease
MDRLMCQQRHRMEQMISLALIAYAIGLVLGETLRSHLFPETSRKRKLYSGLFVLLKLKLSLPYTEFRQISFLALQAFHSIVLPVRTFV